MNRLGFALMEVIVVILIVAIIASAVALIGFGGEPSSVVSVSPTLSPSVNIAPTFKESPGFSDDSLGIVFNVPEAFELVEYADKNEVRLNSVSDNYTIIFVPGGSYEPSTMDSRQEQSDREVNVGGISYMTTYYAAGDGQSDPDTGGWGSSFTISEVIDGVGKATVIIMWSESHSSADGIEDIVSEPSAVTIEAGEEFLKGIQVTE